MRILSIDEYNTLMDYLSARLRKLLEHENIVREFQGNKPKDYFHGRYPLTNCCSYVFDDCIAYRVNNNLFIEILRSYYPQALLNHSDLFKTGDAKAIIQALYNVMPTFGWSLERFAKFLSNEISEGCLSLKKIRLSKNLIKLGENALPKKIQEIDCNSENFNIIDKCLLSNKNELLWIPLELQELNLPRKIIYKHEKCITYNNCIVSISGSLLWTIHNVADFEFPEGIVKIDSGAFYGNTNIQTIKIPYGVKRIEKGAFGYNQNLKSIYLPSSIEYIGNLHTYQGRGRKYIEFFYPKEIHIPKGMKKYFLNLLPGIQETNLIDDYSLNE